MRARIVALDRATIHKKELSKKNEDVVYDGVSKMKRRLQTYPILIIALIAMMAMGCKRWIYDDLSHCPQGVHFQFFTQSPCEASPSYPQEIKQIRLFAFDEHQRLVEEYTLDKVTLSADYLFETRFYQMGNFTFVAWGSSDLSSFDFSKYEIGKTTKEQMILSMRRQSHQHSTPLVPLYYGSTPEPLVITDRSQMGSVFDLVAINMQEVTNRVHFTIHGLPEEGEYQIAIEDDNGRYTFGGDFATDERFTYRYPMHKSGKTIQSDFTLMKLAKGRHAKLTIINTLTGEIIYSVNLVEDLILYTGQFGNPPYSLECDHDFNIDIVLEKPDNTDTWMVVRVTINNWNIVYRTEILG